MQEHSCKEIANSIFANAWSVENDKELIQALVDWSGKSATELARGAGLTPSTLTRPLNHPVKHQLSKRTLDALKATYKGFPAFAEKSDQPIPSEQVSYMEIEVLPTFAGMGGGGTGDGDREVALVPRALIEDILRGQPRDFLVINVRGDSMEPDFHHGDQLLIDVRDTSPAQPGVFALWDGEWGEYVVKNVERSRTGEVRIFSTNPKYTDELVQAETTKIIGRPVWFGRRL